MIVLLVGSLVAMSGTVTADEVDPEEDAQFLRDEIDRLEQEMYDKVILEINSEAEEVIGTPIVTEGAYPELYDPQSPDEARALGDALYDDFYDFNPDIEDAQEGLYDAAEGVENFTVSLNDAADALEAADDPQAEAERIDEEVITEVNAGLEETDERLEHASPIEGVEYLTGPPGENGETEVTDDTADDTETDTEADDGDDAEDGMGSPLLAVGAVAALLAVATALQYRH